ncbi:leucine-rich repeat-containing protein 70 isoform X1 [Bombyx mori]|uniref:Uncharacterized protein n=1 Tax=Bombyx mori TaxID=7091 RepID=A0A8R2AVN0_BOMMO|nr:leucine-rich repeat-containing protein 70 [Bombyx mori]
MALRFFIFIAFCISFVLSEFCPKQCDCDMSNGLNRAICVDQNIIDINVGVSKAVQVYSLKHNVISELDNFCFKESGYTALKLLDISYNLIFWIGLHAFSGLEKLIYLNLSNNRLRYIPSDLFWDTPQLEHLDLSSNVFESLKNEPFIMHTKLQILNLNNCRIRSLPDRLFTRLPNLKKLDISENYVVILSENVLKPLNKLERLEMWSGYWQCSPDFIAIETWIKSKGINYQNQCTKGPKRSEKIISTVSLEKAPVDLSTVWNTTVNKNETTKVTESKRPLTPLEKFDREFSAIQALVMGLEMGLAIGIVGTYVWLRRFFSCARFSCRANVRRRTRRLQRSDAEMRANLLWSTIINPDVETPPTAPNRRPPGGVSNTTDGARHADAIRVPNRSETPPPPYNECCINI